MAATTVIYSVFIRFPLLEEFAESREHPDPLPLVVVVNCGAGVVVPADSDADFDCG